MRRSIDQRLAESAALIAAGKIHPIVSQVVAPGEIAQVHRALQDGLLIGRGAVEWKV